MNDFITWSGWIFGLLGVAGVAWGLWARSHPKKTLLVLAVRQTPIGVPADSRVQVTYDGHKVESPVMIEFTVKHVGGPDIAVADMPEDGIIAVAAEDKILGPLIGTDEIAVYDPTTRTISIKPYLISGGTRLVTFMADGSTAVEPKLQIANAELGTTFPGQPWMWVFGPLLPLAAGAALWHALSAPSWETFLFAILLTLVSALTIFGIHLQNPAIARYFE